MTDVCPDPLVVPLAADMLPTVVYQVMVLPDSGSPFDVRVAVSVIDSKVSKVKLKGEILRAAAAPTFRIQVLVCVFPTPLPVMVTPYSPRGVVLGILIVRVELDSPRAGEMMESLKVMLASSGTPDADRRIASSEAQLPEVETAIVAVAEPPGGTLPLEGVAVSVKSTSSNERVKV